MRLSTQKGGTYRGLAVEDRRARIDRADFACRRDTCIVRVAWQKCDGDGPVRRQMKHVFASAIVAIGNMYETREAACFDDECPAVRRDLWRNGETKVMAVERLSVGQMESFGKDLPAGCPV
jgi:hypothetical protein